jgi:sugar lactone lactonase YvrE
MSMLKKSLGATLAITVAYLLLWPVPINPVSITLAPAPAYGGKHATNNRLAALEHIDLKGDLGPEHIAIGPDGKLYTGVASGNILRMNADGSGLEVFANTGGRALGLDFDASGNLIAADAHKGLIAIAADKTVSVLVDKVEGQSILFADAVAVAKDGKIYFSDASTRFAPKDWGGVYMASVMDMLEGSATGRILVYNPSDRSTHIVATGLNFANGVALTADQQHLLVNETGRFRVWRIAVTARKLDLLRAVDGAVPPIQARVLLDNLPGYPDNLMRGPDGKIWLGLAAPRSADADRLADKPFIRKIVMRLPHVLWPIPKPYGHVMAFDEDGKILMDLQDPQGAYPETTAVTETADRLYVQSLNARTIGWMSKPR